MAIIFEVAATSSLNASQSFTRLVPSIGVNRRGIRTPAEG
ncbi:MAG: hypothetical protein L0Y57_05000 [Beijerinckiaceae bacterium]|nr:hypothetical protein [Beijerinckiaceae bacterium]